MNIQALLQLFRPLLVVLCTLALVACQGQQPASPKPPEPPVSVPVAAPGSRVVITPGVLLLAAAGQKRQLSAALLDAQDSPVQTAFKWTSSNPALVRVDAGGALETLGNLGSAQIGAEAKGVRAGVLVVAQSVAGTVLVTDAQVLERPRLLGDGPTALGSRYQITLSGVDPPAVLSLNINAWPGVQPISHISGKVTVPQGVAVKDTLVVACFVVGTDSCDDAKTAGVAIKQSSNSAAYTIPILAAGEYVMIAAGHAGRGWRDQNH